MREKSKKKPMLENCCSKQRSKVHGDPSKQWIAYKTITKTIQAFDFATFWYTKVRRVKHRCTNSVILKNTKLELYAHWTSARYPQPTHTHAHTYT